MIGNRMRAAKIIAKRRMDSISWLNRCSEEEKKKMKGMLRKGTVNINGSRHYEKEIGVPTIQEKKWEGKEKQMIDDLEDDIIEDAPYPKTIYETEE